MAKAIIVLALIKWVWIFTLLIGTSYVVFGLGYSGWWFLLAILLMSTSNPDEEEKKTQVKPNS